LLARFGLPTAPERWPAAELMTTMQSDKKAVAGQMRFILPCQLGEVSLFDDVPAADVAAVLAECSR
jgi:3-dehydroquinate synthase